MSYPFRGLTNFITELRYCHNKEEEINRVEKELSHIRESFLNPKKMKQYDRKKFALKLMYMSIIGYNIDFGHKEAMELIFSTQYQDKIIGYTVLSVFINENSEILRLVSQSLLSDLTNVRRTCFNSMALAFIANCGNSELAESLANNVAKILMNQKSPPYLIKKSSLCLLHLYKKNPEQVQPSTWVERMNTLLGHTDGGVLTSIFSLLHGFAHEDPTIFSSLVPITCRLLHNVILTKGITGDYMYDHIPAPWLLVKGFQFLQYFNTIEDQQAIADLEVCLKRVINTESKNFIMVDKATGQVRKRNAMLAVLFEAVNLVTKLKLNPAFIKRSIQHVKHFLAVGDPDARYLSLEATQRLCPLDPSLTGDDPAFVAIVDKALLHPDISLRRRALDVLFEMCNENNSGVIVNRLVDYLDIAEFELKEELVLKIAILAEKFPVDTQWYLDIIFKLIQTAGDASPQEIWFRTVQIISTQPTMQEYAVVSALVMIKEKSLPENAIKFAAYLLGEYHNKIPKNPEVAENPLEEVVFKLQHHYGRAQPLGQAITITSLSKIAADPATLPDIKEDITTYIKQQATNISEDTQERSCEVIALLTGDAAQAAATLAAMPQFAFRQSILLKDLKKKVKKAGGVTRGSVHLEGITDNEPDDDDDDSAQQQAQASALAAAAAATAQSQAKAAPPPEDVPQEVPVETVASDSDILATISGGTSSTAAANSTPIEKWFNQLVKLNEGVLYEDANVLISCKHEYKGAEGRLMLVYKSKVVGQIQNISAVFAPPEGLTVNAQPLSTTDLQAQGETIQQGIVLTCSAPFIDPPSFTFSYRFGLDSQNVVLKLPTTVGKFLSAMTPPKEDYVRVWDSITAGSPLENTSVFLPKGTAVNPPVLQAVVGSLSNTFKFQLLQGYDAIPQTISFASGLNISSSPQPMPLMLKVSAAAEGMISVCVKTANPSLTAATNKYIVSYLALADW